MGPYRVTHPVPSMLKPLHYKMLSALQAYPRNSVRGREERECFKGVLKGYGYAVSPAPSIAADRHEERRHMGNTMWRTFSPQSRGTNQPVREVRLHNGAASNDLTFKVWSWLGGRKPSKESFFRIARDLLGDALQPPDYFVEVISGAEPVVLFTSMSETAFEAAVSAPVEKSQDLYLFPLVEVRTASSHLDVC